MIDVWMNSVFKPKETFAAEKNNATIGKGLVNYVIAALVSSILTLIVATVAPSLFPATVVALGIMGIVGAVIGGLIVPFISVGILWIFAKIFGGKGNYTGLYYLVSLYAVPMAVVSWIPIVSILAGLYALYLLFLVLKEQQEMSGGRAVATILVPIIVVAILVAILVAIAGVALLGYLAGAGIPTDFTGLA